MEKGTKLLRNYYITQLAATSLPTSRALPIAIIGTTAANSVAKPTIE